MTAIVARTPRGPAAKGPAAKKRGGGQADGTRRSYFVFDPNELIIIGLDTNDGQDHPLWDERIHLPLSEPMIRNIRVRGVLEPITFVRDGDRALVVDGRQRVRHAREALTLQVKAGEFPLVVPGIPRRGNDAELFGVARTLNAHRTADGPMTNARNVERMAAMGLSEDRIALEMGVTPQTVKAWRLLLDLAPVVCKAVEAGALSATAASTLAKLPRAEQIAKLGELTAGGARPTIRAATNKVREANGQAPTETPSARLKKIIAELIDFNAEKDDPHHVIAQIKAHAGMEGGMRAPRGAA
jgi:ParB family transcriptional regulator, chromosome partitioning protein